MAESSSEKGWVAGFLAGALAGAAAALLLAPGSGRETRRRVRRWWDELEDRGRDMMAEGRDQIEDRAAEVKKTLRQITRSVKDSLP